MAAIYSHQVGGFFLALTTLPGQVVRRSRETVFTVLGGLVPELLARALGAFLTIEERVSLRTLLTFS